MQSYRTDTPASKTALRLFPVKLLLSAWWGDWDDRGTPEPGDDLIKPLILWRVRQITGGAVLPAVTDDKGDGIPEVNRPEEILAYLQALKGPDSYGKQVAARPVLVKGGRIYYEDPAAESGIAWFEVAGTGIQVEDEHPFSVNHNVTLPSQALGAIGCQDCHKAFSGAPEAPVFDRRILVDPFGFDGQPVYKRLREVSGVDPP